jgi:hypothetical protein
MTKTKVKTIWDDGSVKVEVNRALAENNVRLATNILNDIGNVSSNLTIEEQEHLSKALTALGDLRLCFLDLPLLTK